MTTTGPRPPDLPFDHAAAAAAVAALDRAGAVLADRADGRSAAAATAREHFRGVYADDFGAADRELGAASSDARSAAAALASAIAAASEAAHAAQAARGAEQQAWDAAQVPPTPVRVA